MKKLSTSNFEQIKRHFIALMLFLILPNIGYGADKVYLYSGQIFDCEVLEIDTSTVIIKISETGIRRTFYKNEVKVIIYADGAAETFPVTTSVQPAPQQTVGKNQELEKRVREQEIKTAKSSGVSEGIGICVLILLVLLVI